MAPPTRAEIARDRLARLAEAFEAENARPVASEVDERSPSWAIGRLKQFRPSREQVRAVAIVAGLAIVVLLWWLATPGRPGSAAATSTQVTSQAPRDELVVDVEGQVARPGIVTVPAGSRVADAVEAAGGVTGDVEATGLNLARELNDGEQIIVGGQATAQPSADTRVNLNTAGLVELDSLPGIGPVTAQAILDWRVEHGGFASVDDLLDVKGIGESTLAEISDLVTV